MKNTSLQVSNSPFSHGAGPGWGLYTTEPLDADELQFLRRKEARDRAQFYRAVRLILGVCFAAAFLVAWGKALIGVPDPFSPKAYFGSVLFLGCFAGGCCYISYRAFLRKIQLDIRSLSKLVERAHITRKLYMPQTNTWHFYLDSPTQLSIEVSEKDYQQLSVGDELNIEYTAVSKMYLGYF